MKRTLIFLVIALVLPIIILTWLIVTDSGLQWLYQQTKSYLPAEFSVHQIHGRIIGPIIMAGVEYSQDDIHIKSKQITIDWSPRSLLAARLTISHIDIQSLDIVLPVEDKNQQAIAVPEINLPWNMKIENAVINDVNVIQGEQSYVLKKITLKATALLDKIKIQKLDIINDIFQVHIRGALHTKQNYPHNLKIQWQAQLPDNKLMKGNGQLTGNLKQSKLTQQLTEPLALTLKGDITDLLDKLRWQTSIHAPHFDLAQFNSGWPALSGEVILLAEGNLGTARLTGSLKGQHPEVGALQADFKLQQRGDQSIQIELLDIQVPENNTQLSATGLWQPGKQAGNINLALNWKNLRWPYQIQPWFNSANGSGTLEGTLDRYQIKLNSDSPWPDILPSTWQANAEGNLHGLNFHSIQVKTLKGEAIAKGQLSWNPVLSWTAEVSASDVDPSGLWPQWPGQLHGKLTSTGRFDNNQWIADADISRISGKLRSYPVSLRSHVNWRNDQLDIKQLALTSGGTKVNLQGQAGDTLKLDWNIASSNLKELYPAAAGQLHAKGRLSAKRSSPFLEASFDGKAIKLSTYEVGTIKGTMAADLLKWQKVNVNVAAQALKLNKYTLRSLDINADSQHVKAIAVSETASAHIEVVGEVQEKGWSGHLQRADLRSQKFSNWQLNKPVPIHVSDQSVTVNRFCWHNEKEGKLCSLIEYKDATWLSQIEMNKLPLMVFSHWLPPELTLNGDVNATADLQFKTPGHLLGSAEIELPSGSASYSVLEGERDHWEYRRGQIKIDVNRQRLEMVADLAMTNGDILKSRLLLPEANIFTLTSPDQRISGTTQLSIHNLGLIELMIPEIQDLKGHAALALDVNGTLGQPRLSGYANILNATLRIPKLGLTINELNLKGESNDLGKVNFTLDARSGKGKLAVQGHTLMDKNSGWPTMISIKGDNIEAARIPEAQIQISPDLQVKIHSHNIDIKGNVLIPYAKLQPKDVTTAAHVSSDVVIIGGENLRGPKWSLTSQIRITLGERVNFYGFGFEGLLGGSLLLEDEPGQLTKATGEINIPEGRYRAYGQRLEVEQGRLLFTGGPLTNPGLDMRAIRRVENIIAGVKVRGTLNQPKLELFSNPAMGQTDVLAYLLLGRPVENTSAEEGAMMTNAALALGLSGGDRIARLLGDKFRLDEMRVESSDSGNQASLVMGRYLSPRLYVSYGVGLIEAINTLSVRYKISEKWQIKGESGEQQGADILYTIKR